MFSARSLIVVDFGTATTFDCVQDNAYLGGLIFPGLHSSAAALSAKTPRIDQSMTESLRHGLLFGFAAMVEGLCARLKSQLLPPVEVIVTGGPAKTLLPICTGIDHYCPDLLLQGLLRLSSKLSTEMVAKGGVNSFYTQVRYIKKVNE